MYYVLVYWMYDLIGCYLMVSELSGAELILMPRVRLSLILY